MMFLHLERAEMVYKRQKQYRLPGFDYAGEGDYFVTICIHDRKQYFGKIEDGKMILSPLGKIVDEIWNKIPNEYKNVRLGSYQIMPDHFHGIVSIIRKNFINEIPTFKSGIKNNPMELKNNSLGRMIRWFKGKVKFEASNINSDFKWQSRFYDRIIRNEKEYYFISEYIMNNPINWGQEIIKDYIEKNP